MNTQNVMDNIFQSFFTTIPITIGTTGQGTGLGLSLSYDIVKAQGGEIKVNTIESKGTEFTIQLPIEKTYDKKNKHHHPACSCSEPLFCPAKQNSF